MCTEKGLKNKQQMPANTQRRATSAPFSLLKSYWIKLQDIHLSNLTNSKG